MHPASAKYLRTVSREPESCQRTRNTVLQAWQLDVTVRSTFPMTFADGSTGLTIEEARISTLPKSRSARVQPLRPAIPFRKPRNRRRARIPTPAEQQATVFLFRKARHEK